MIATLNNSPLSGVAPEPLLPSCRSRYLEWCFYFAHSLQIFILAGFTIQLFSHILFLLFKLFIDFPGEEKIEHKIVNPEMGKKYFHKLEYPKPTHDLFLKQKPENGIRIFVMGSSTVVGFPYDENLMFSRILRGTLSALFRAREYRSN